MVDTPFSPPPEDRQPVIDQRQSTSANVPPTPTVDAMANQFLGMRLSES